MLPADELLQLMNTISEDDFAAGWRIDLEYILWRRVLSGRPDRRTQTLESLSGTAHGWWAWLPAGEGREEGRKFVPLDEWCALFAADPVRGAEVDRDTLDFAPPLAAPAGAPEVIDGSREHWELRACAHSVERSHPLLARDLRERYRLGVETPKANKLDEYKARMLAGPGLAPGRAALLDGHTLVEVGEPIGDLVWIARRGVDEAVAPSRLTLLFDATPEQVAEVKRRQDAVLAAEGLVRSYEAPERRPRSWPAGCGLVSLRPARAQPKASHGSPPRSPGRSSTSRRSMATWTRRSRPATRTCSPRASLRSE